jgi:hypothetical protein
MTRRFMVLGFLAAFLIGAMPAFAHDDYRIIGTIEKVSATRIAVKQTKDDKVISMTLRKAVKVTRDEKSVPVSELKTGLNVVVDARGDSIDKLIVAAVKIVPPAK